MHRVWLSVCPVSRSRSLALRSMRLLMLFALQLALALAGKCEDKWGKKEKKAGKCGKMQAKGMCVSDWKSFPNSCPKKAKKCARAAKKCKKTCGFCEDGVRPSEKCDFYEQGLSATSLNSGYCFRKEKRGGVCTPATLGSDQKTLQCDSGSMLSYTYSPPPSPPPAPPSPPPPPPPSPSPPPPTPPPTTPSGRR